MLRNTLCFLTMVCCLSTPVLAQSPEQLIRAMEWVDLSAEDFAARLTEDFPSARISLQGGLELLPESTDDPYYWYMEGTISFGSSVEMSFYCAHLGERTHQHLVAIHEKLSKTSDWPTYPPNSFGVNTPLVWEFKTMLKGSSHAWPGKAVTRLGCSLVGQISAGTAPSLDEVKTEAKRFFGDVPFISLYGAFPIFKDDNVYEIINASPASKDAYLFESTFVAVSSEYFLLRFSSYELFQGS